MTGIVVAFFVGAAFGAYGVVFFAKRATVSHLVPVRMTAAERRDRAMARLVRGEGQPEPDYYGYLQSRGRIEDPHSRPYGDA